MSAASNPLSRALPVLLSVYCVASLVHFAHNAEFLTDYPNLPTWLTRLQIYEAWVGITAIGVVGYVLARARYPWAGLTLLTLYAALGLDGLAHYGRAPFAAHTAMMNFTILFEVGAAIAVLAAIVWIVGKNYRTTPP
jgi:hypothetical protein